MRLKSPIWVQWRLRFYDFSYDKGTLRFYDFSYDKENVRWIAKSDNNEDYIAFTEDYNLMGSKEWTIQNDSKVY